LYAWTDCAGGGAGVEGTALKNCVKLPSADAEPETPGEEKPFKRDGLAAGGVNCGGSTKVFAEWSGVGIDPVTKTRVNSPGAGAGAGCDSSLVTGCSATGGGWNGA
jgi:hypothetical protein